MAEKKAAPKPDTKDDDDDVDDLDDATLGDGGNAALRSERRLRRAAERKARDLEAKRKADAETNESEMKQLADQVSKLTKDNESDRIARYRAEVAQAKGLTARQAARLTGTTKEELEDDADDLLESFPGATSKDDADDGDDGKDDAADGDDGKKPDRKPSGAPPSSRPKTDLRGGNDPGDLPEKIDPAKLADAIPRP